MSSPSRVISATAVYDREEAMELLGVGETKLGEIVAAGRLNPMNYTSAWRFLGEEILRFCREATA